MKKSFLIILFFLAGVSVIFAEEPSTDTGASDETPQQFQGFDLAGYTQKGQKSWDLKGDTADIIGNIVKLTNINANSYGDEKTNLTAKNGTLDKVTGNVHLEDDVVIVSDTGTTMKTDSLDWQKEKDLVHTDDQVTIKREGMEAIGQGADAHPSLNIAQMNKDVTVNVNTEPKNPLGRIMTITCDGPLEVDYQKQVAVFNNNVVGVDLDRKLMADKLELYFDNATKKIREVVCIGHVVITQGENTSYSDRAVYYAGDQRVVLSGQPKLIFYTEDQGGSPFGKDIFKTPQSQQPEEEQKTY